MHRSLATLSAVIAAALVAQTATAQDRVNNTERVTYEDLDLRTEAGARAALTRIKRAAARACVEPSTPAIPRYGVDAYRCKATAVARGVATLDAPLVTAAFRGDAPSAAAVIAER